MATDYSIELAKVRALNKQNWEIFSRLTKYSYCESCRQYSPCSMHTWSKFLRTHGIVAVTFDGDTLNFRRTCFKYEWEEIGSYFKDVPNTFNDKLPTKSYFDLEDVLNKYELLDPKAIVCMDIISKWKSAMEEIHVALGKLEQQISNDLETTRNILQLFQFQIHENYYRKQHQRVMKPKDSNTKITFECTVPKNIPQLIVLKQLLDELYDETNNNPEKKK